MPIDWVVASSMQLCGVATNCLLLKYAPWRQFKVRWLSSRYDRQPASSDSSYEAIALKHAMPLGLMTLDYLPTKLVGN